MDEFKFDVTVIDTMISSQGRPYLRRVWKRKVYGDLDKLLSHPRATKLSAQYEGKDRYSSVWLFDPSFKSGD